MTVKSSEFSKKMYVYNDSLEKLRRLTQEKELPESLRSECLALHKKFLDYDMQQHADPKKSLTGNVLTREEAAEILLNTSGYIKWKGEENTSEVEDLKNHFQEEYSVNITDFKVYEFHKSTNNRNEIYFVGFHCMPGHVSVSMSTDRVGFGSDSLIPNAELAAYMQGQFD